MYVYPGYRLVERERGEGVLTAFVVQTAERGQREPTATYQIETVEENLY